MQESLVHLRGRVYTPHTTTTSEATRGNRTHSGRCAYSIYRHLSIRERVAWITRARVVFRNSRAGPLCAPIKKKRGAWALCALLLRSRSQLCVCECMCERTGINGNLCTRAALERKKRAFARVRGRKLNARASLSQIKVPLSTTGREKKANHMANRAASAFIVAVARGVCFSPRKLFCRMAVPNAIKCVRRVM